MLTCSRPHRNFKRMQERRIVFTIGVTTIPLRIRWRASDDHPRSSDSPQQQVRFDRSHFVAYGESALNSRTVYFVLTADYLTHVDVLQAINLQIFDSSRRRRSSSRTRRGRSSCAVVVGMPPMSARAAMTAKNAEMSLTSSAIRAAPQHHSGRAARCCRENRAPQDHIAKLYLRAIRIARRPGIA
jgi:hypothetical protein